MAKYRLLYGLLYAGSAVFALAYESKLSFVLFAGVAILPVITLILLILSGMLLKIEVVPDATYVSKRQTFSVAVRVANRFIVPVSPMMITCTFHDEDGSVISGRRLVLSTSALRRTEYVFTGSIRYRGEYVLGVEDAVIYDLLRIFRFRIRRSPVCTITVTPRRILLEEAASLCTDDFDSDITKVSFMDSSTFSSVRPYEEGDLLKRVHWKLSAKQDELMVKQAEQNLGSSALIITDMHSFSPEEEDDLRAADAAAETALALTKKIIEDGRTAVNIYRPADGEVDVFPADRPEAHEHLVSVFAVLPVTENGAGAEALVPRAAEELTGTEPVFIITPETDAEVFASIVREIGDLCGEIRLYLTASDPDAKLTAEVQAAKNAAVYRIDPEDVAISLRNSLSQRL